MQLAASDPSKLVIQNRQERTSTLFRDAFLAAEARFSPKRQEQGSDFLSNPCLKKVGFLRATVPKIVTTPQSNNPYKTV
jgi:hypothetical protein